MRSFTFALRATLVLWIFCLVTFTPKAINAQLTFGGNSQHTGIYNAAAQPLNTIKWQTDIDLNNNAGQLAHYGSPVVSAANTVFVPVKTAGNGFRVDAFDGNNGNFKYTVATDYILPTSSWIIPYNLCIVGTRLYFAGAGGTMLHVDNIDSNSPSAAVREVFYTSLANYNANTAGFNNTVFVNTPIVADSAGNIFFGFRVQGVAPAPLNTTQGGLARISFTGVTSFVLAGTAAADALIDRDGHAAGPALSNDQSSVYFPLKSSTDALRSYLVELDSTTLATKNKVQLKDPRNGGGAQINDISTSTPVVGPDGDVYYGVFGSSGNGSRGFLLHFSGDLQTTKIPGAFGWDYTPGIVPASMVPSYGGTSSYLLFCKYNNYVSQDGNGVNRVAILDPNATQTDPHSSAIGLVEMREVLTVIGPTPDDAGPSFPFAVQEFCINAPAVNPATGSVFFDSEDGHLYRWNLITNSLDQALTLSAGIGQPYVPTVIGPDGTVYTLNGGNLFAIGSKPNISMTIRSSRRDLRTTVFGDPVTFTATVAGGTGTVTFVDVTFNGLTPVTTTLASDVPLDGLGRATTTTSTLAAGGNNFGNHFITAIYSGDAINPSTSVTMVQKVHPNASTTSLGVSNTAVNPGDLVTFTATVSPVPTGAGQPTGMVTFFDVDVPIGQAALNASNQASFASTSLAPGVHTILAVYQSDTIFSSSFDQRQVFVGPVVQFTSANTTVSEGAGHVDVQVSLVGTAQSTVKVNYEAGDSNFMICSISNGAASSRCDYLNSRGTLTFNPGETSKTISIPIVDDAFAEGNETFNVTLSNPSGGSLGTSSTTVTITDNETVNGPNPIDQTDFFVRQQYLDFLNREPDTGGLNFWTNEINSCGANAQCIEVKRINVSAAFFLSIEFQETGYLVERLHKVTFGDAQAASTLGGQQHPLLVPVIRFDQFLTDSQAISNGVIVGQAGWPDVLENNKRQFASGFVQRAEFLAAFPLSLTPTQFVDKLNLNAGAVLSTSEGDQLIADLTNGTKTRDQVVRAVAEDSDLVNNEKNRAFVLMEYFGYLRRDPNGGPDIDYTGYDFWLTKLIEANGNFIRAEMVKAFISSDEYRRRFGP